jgi:FkbM family methyltransferase
MKAFIKKFPLMVIFFKFFLKPANLIFNLFFYKPKHINAIRKILFNSTEDRYLISDGSSGSYFLVSSEDKGVSRAVYANEETEFKKLALVLMLLKIEKADLLIDIGANIGTICIPAINNGLFSKSIAFEPDPSTFNLLKANIFLNNLQEKITAYNFALSNKNSSLKFEVSKKNPADNRIRLESKNLVNLYDEDKRKVIEVKSLKLDDITSKFRLSKKTLIWVDVQGYEGHVLDGAKKNTFK